MAPAYQRAPAMWAFQRVAALAVPALDGQVVVNALEADLAHLGLEVATVTGRQAHLVQPGMHHLMEQRRRDLPGMACEQRQREFDDRRAITDAAGARRHSRVVPDAMRAQRATEVFEVEPREEQLEVCNRGKWWGGCESGRDRRHYGVFTFALAACCPSYARASFEYYRFAG